MDGCAGPPEWESVGLRCAPTREALAVAAAALGSSCAGRFSPSCGRPPRRSRPTWSARGQAACGWNHATTVTQRAKPRCGMPTAGATRRVAWRQSRRAVAVRGSRDGPSSGGDHRVPPQRLARVSGASARPPLAPDVESGQVVWAVSGEPSCRSPLSAAWLAADDRRASRLLPSMRRAAWPAFPQGRRRRGPTQRTLRLIVSRWLESFHAERDASSPADFVLPVPLTRTDRVLVRMGLRTRVERAYWDD
jgi:hypothetical protein